MSDVYSAPEGGEGDSAPVTVVTPAADTGSDISVSQAAKALAAARHKPKPVEAAPNEAAPVENELADEANAAPVEEQAPGEDATEAEPAKEPPIERPRSWTKDEDAEWQSLPRAMQLKIVAREQERDTGLRRSQNEAAEKLKGLTAKEQAVEKARQEYEAKLPAIMQALQDAQQGAYSDIKTVDDVTRLAQEDPFRYLQWQAHQQKMQAVNYELTQAEARKTQEHQTEWAKHVQKENELFAEAAPEFADKAKAKELTDKAVEKLLDIGFSDQELGELAQGKTKLSVYDHRIQLLILDALKYADVQKAKTAAVAKPVPPVQRPGAARPNGAAQSEQLQALTSRLNSSGSLKDAAAVLAARRARR